MLCYLRVMSSYFRVIFSYLRVMLVYLSDVEFTHKISLTQNQVGLAVALVWL